jgi:rare lipoprotein A (peptidoglycan hydrolase)
MSPSTRIRRRRGALVAAGAVALTAGAIVGAATKPADWRRAVASTYGGAQPLACGGRLQPGQEGVAHRTLPCGTELELRHGGRTLKTKVIDRGPYVAGRTFDLTNPAAAKLGIDNTVTEVEWRRP